MRFARATRRSLFGLAVACLLVKSHSLSAETAGPPVPIGGLTGRLGGFSGEFAGRLLQDYQTQLQLPFRYAGRHPLRFSLGCAGLAALIATDHYSYDILASKGFNDGHGLSGPAAHLSKWGGGRTAVPLVLGIGAFGIIADSPRERETSLMLVEALLTSATWTELLKTTAGRERPRDREEVVSDWTGLEALLGDEEESGAGFRSFPSGHSTGIWAAATILAHQYPSHGVVPVLAYGTAVAMGYSRIAVGAHWLSDVVVGGLVGYSCAKQVLSAHGAGRRMDAASGLSMGLDIGGEYKGVTLRYDF